jgi:TonB family protein
MHKLHRFPPRSLLLTAVTIALLPAVALCTDRESPGPDLLEGITVRDEGAGIVWYSPEYDDWALPRLKVVPFCVRWEDAARVLYLVGIVKTNVPVGVESLDLEVDGISTTVEIDRTELETNRRGCMVRQAVKLRESDHLVRSIAAATAVAIRFGIPGTERRLELTQEDLAGFRRIVEICDATEVPETQPRSEEKPNVNPGITNPVLITKFRKLPKYPETARQMRREGRVKLEAVVHKDGTVGDLKVVESGTPDCGFEDAAIAAVRRWKYKPAVKNGARIAVRFAIIVDFFLDR